MSDKKDDSQLDMFQPAAVVADESKSKAAKFLGVVDLARKFEWLPQLSAIEVNGEKTIVVDARELFTALGVGRDFSNWIKHWTGQGMKFFNHSGSTLGLRNLRVDYWVPVDSAKEVLMRSKAPRAAEVRQYFIKAAEGFAAGYKSERITDAERTAAHAAESRAATLPVDRLPTRREYAMALLDAEERAEAALERAEAADATIAVLQPKADIVDRHFDTKGNRSITVVAKELGYKRHILIGNLISLKAMYRSQGNLVPYENHIDAGRFTVKLGSNEHASWAHTLVTPKGELYIAELLQKELKKLPPGDIEA